MFNGVFGFLAVVASAFAALCALLYWRQENFIFFPRPNDAALVQKHQANRVVIEAADAQLAGWWIANPRATSDAVILYFGGNAEDVLYMASTAPMFNAHRMLVVNYRGYGGSTGKPGQKALYDDALVIYQHAVTAGGAAPEQIVVMGRSLGSGVAAMLAAERPVRGAILITPFDSLAAVAARHYSFMPVRLLLRHPFPSVDWARQAKAPALILAAERDHIVPPLHAQRLYAAWAGDKQIHILSGVGHNDIELNSEYYRLINEFLASG
jgi:pimeloyl-ACP methyl ester carboxylesterase